MLALYLQPSTFPRKRAFKTRLNPKTLNISEGAVEELQASFLDTTFAIHCEDPLSIKTTSGKLENKGTCYGVLIKDPAI